MVFGNAIFCIYVVSCVDNYISNYKMHCILSVVTMDPVAVVYVLSLCSVGAQTFALADTYVGDLVTVDDTVDVRRI